jgi:RHS repeat-associated protein
MVALKPAFNHLAAKVHFPATRTANSGLGSAFFRPQNSARYLNPQTGLWLSTDPAMGEYVPQAPINDDAKKANQNLAGMGGVFNVVNLHVYHYAGNNPVKYVDPDGRSPGTHEEEQRIKEKYSPQRQRVALEAIPGAAWNRYNDELLPRPSGVYIGEAPQRYHLTIGFDKLLMLADLFPMPHSASFDDIDQSPSFSQYAPRSQANGESVDGMLQVLTFTLDAASRLYEQDDFGAKVGEVSLVYWRNRNGSVVKWNLQQTIRSPATGRLITYALSRQQSRELLNALREADNSALQKTYNKILHVLDR